jgi:hypothetical protein
MPKIDLGPVTGGSAINKTLFTDAEIGVSGDALEVDFSRFNPSTGATSNHVLELPLASDVAGGLMPAASFAALSELVTDVGVLKAGNRRRPTNTALPGTLSDAQVQAAWEAAGGSASPVDGDTLISFNEDTLAYAWSFFGADEVWRFRGVDSVLPATNSTLGVVRGSLNDGQVFVENNATLSVNGWNNLKNGVLPVGTLLPALNVPNGALGDSWVEFDGGTILRDGNEDVAPLLGDMRQWSSEPSSTQILAQFSSSASGGAVLVLPDGVVLVATANSGSNAARVTRSTNHGATFTPAAVPSTTLTSARLATFEWFGEGRVLLGITAASQYYFSYSNDGGVTWTPFQTFASGGNLVGVACDDTLFLSGKGYVYFAAAQSSSAVLFGFYNPETNVLKTASQTGGQALLLSGTHDPDTGVSKVFTGYYYSSNYYSGYYTVNGTDTPTYTAITSGPNATTASLGTGFLQCAASTSGIVANANIPLRRGNGFDLLRSEGVHKFIDRTANTQSASTVGYVVFSGYVEYSSSIETGRCARNRLLHGANIDPFTLKGYSLETGLLEDSALGGLIPAYSGYGTVSAWAAALYDAAPVRARAGCTTTNITASMATAKYQAVMLEPGQTPGLLLANFAATFTGDTTRLVFENQNSHLYNPTSGDLVVIKPSGNDLVALTYPPLLNYENEIQTPWASGLIARVK